ncbi:DNA repair protein RadC [bacterium]|nr:DNA repair protein RadC [bacterium]
MLQRRKPRELSSLFGYTSLKNSELWSLILRSGTRKQSVFSISRKVSPLVMTALEKEMPSHMFEKFLSSKLQIGTVRRQVIMGVYELFMRQKSGKITTNNFSSPEPLVSYFCRLQSKKQEYVYGVYLTARLQLIQTELLAKGTTDSVMLDVRDLLYYAIKYRSRNFIVVHNHPSGDPTPSSEDVTLTKRIKIAAELLSLQFVDHIIVSKQAYFSFKESRSVL